MPPVIIAKTLFKAKKLRLAENTCFLGDIKHTHSVSRSGQKDRDTNCSGPFASKHLLQVILLANANIAWISFIGGN